MLNKIIIMGRLCAAPELRRTQSGTPVASVTVAVDRDFKEQDGTRNTDFIPVVAWKKTAEMLAQYFGKGQMIVVSGRLQIRDWTDRDGNKRKATEIIADSVYFCESKKETGGADRLDALQGRMESAGLQEIEVDGELPF